MVYAVFSIQMRDKQQIIFRAVCIFIRSDAKRAGFMIHRQVKRFYSAQFLHGKRPHIIQRDVRLIVVLAGHKQIIADALHAAWMLPVLQIRFETPHFFAVFLTDKNMGIRCS